ncbi:MAG TPA: hypothetical protein VEL79_12820 [Vicinamibacterales bacterium]|nr:hypothetical protein [Vicinamibacterales bacterium]
MPRAHSSNAAVSGDHANDLHTAAHLHGRALTCVHCTHGLECVEQNRRSGTWVGSFICPNCRSEYFYAYRWGRLLKKG